MKRLTLTLTVLLFAVSSFCAEFPGFGPKPEEWAGVSGVHASWATTDFNFYCYGVPDVKESKDLLLEGWRGEKVFAKALVWTSKELRNVSFKLSDLKGKGGAVIKASDCEAGFITNVISDYDKVICNGCYKNHPSFPERSFTSDSTIVADRIDPGLKYVDMPAMYTQNIWITCPVPSNDYVGDYKGTLTVRSGARVVARMKITVRSNRHVLPAPRQWKHHLDFWVNSASVAKYYKVPLWSKEHLDAMRPVLKRLAAAGQRSVRTAVKNKVAGNNLLEWHRTSDGRWWFDYTAFDALVSLFHEYGIDEILDCGDLYNRKSNVIGYIDDTDGKPRQLNVTYEDAGFQEAARAFVADFAKHLREKGWFEGAMLSSDELLRDAEISFLKLVRETEPEFKLKTARNKVDHDLELEFDYMSVASHKFFDKDNLARRKAEGKVSTSYICCSEVYPNRYVFSDPYESAYISYNTYAKGYDGFLCWAMCAWGSVPDIERDSRGTMFYSGEYYMVYPGGLTTPRWEKIIEGIQDYEKLHILTEEYEKTGNTAAYEELEAALKPFYDDAYANTLKDVLDKDVVTANMARVKALLVK